MEIVNNQEEGRKPKKTFGLLVSLLIVIVAFVIGFNMFFVSVPENYSVSIKRFDKVISVYSEPGLHFKLPIDSAVFIKNNAIVYNLSPSDVLTLDKKAMTVSSYAVWQIYDPLKFLKTAGTEGEAERRLDATVYNAIKNLLGSIEQTEIISMRGHDLENKLIENVAEQMDYYGILVKDIRIKQFDLPTDNKNAVYTRMISEREKIAAQYRAEGKEEADKIRNTIHKESMEIESEAKASGARIIGEGESEYMKILSRAYGDLQRAEFYEFLRTLDALKITMKGDKTLILPIESPLTKMLTGE